jgi:hypothetical protein
VPSPSTLNFAPLIARSMNTWPTRRLTQRGPYSAEGRMMV